VARGIKIALLTTAAGLLSGIILQVGYNYCVSKIDRIIADMEESSITLIDSIILMKEGKPIVPTEPPTTDEDEV
jgi:biopolymer transport protein ExbB